LRVEIVAVGTELLLGQIANTNARWMSERIAEVGADVSHHQAVGDNMGRIVEALRLAVSRSDVVVVTGGLGPTQDDITRDALARLMDAPMERKSEIEELLRAKFAGFGRGPMPENNLRQADVPRGARWIMPELGTAPGLIVDVGGVRVYLVPGVPAEMIEMMGTTILPEIVSLTGAGVVRSKTLRCTGIGESRVAELVADLFDSSSNPSLAYLATLGEVKVRITAKASSVQEADLLIAPLASAVAQRLGDDVFSQDDESLEEAVGRLLLDRSKTLACAESLTGGGVGARITSVPGASAYFVGSAVVYTEKAKRDVLGVKAETLAKEGPVSRGCAREMAAGARAVFEADLALALTGAAGPQAHAGAEPGTVWLALDSPDVQHERGYVSAGGRERVRRWAEQAGLDLLRRYLEGKPLPGQDRVI
jgi:nicotinamide-nucleotide amidase